MGWVRRVLRIEPGVSLGWWIIERVWQLFANWSVIWALVTGGLMTYWATINEIVVAWGIPAVLGVSFATALSVSKVRLWRAKREVELANERYVAARVSASNVNPMHTSFTAERIDLRDLIRPLTSQIRGKTFVGCQIVGPANLVLLGSTNIVHPQGMNCEAVYCDNVDTGMLVSNAINLIDCYFQDCEFFNITFMVLPYQYESLSNSLGMNWLNSNPKGLTFLRDGQMMTRAELLEDKSQEEKPKTNTRRKRKSPDE